LQWMWCHQNRVRFQRLHLYFPNWL
jgi:hypothetical protein